MTERLRVLVLDHRDSFVYNLVRYLEELGAETLVMDSYKVALSDIIAQPADALLLSPGPGHPEEAETSRAAVKALTGKLPILGVCLGHQIIAATFGWPIKRAESPVYGEARAITHMQNDLFKGLPSPLNAGLYHSLIAAYISETPLYVTATSPSGEIMALQHSAAPVFGVQFHPESILSDHGHDLLHNFLTYTQSAEAI